MTDAPGGVYIHVPFCSAICPYCDFAVTLGDDAARAGFVETLLAEIASVDFTGPFDTIYLGGGTPSALAPGQLERVVTAVRERANAPHARLHIEANPEDVDAVSLEAWQALDVRFLSLGVQSFDGDELAWLGRRHDAEDAVRCVELAVGRFETVSVDLIFGLPGQTEASWEANLERAASLSTQHVSCYQLTVHEGTPFERRRQTGGLVELDEDSQGELYLAAHRVLGRHGLTAYEVSNFALGERHRSRHNAKYWARAPYVGIGPSAHSYQGRHRWWNHASLGAWAKAVNGGDSPVAGREEIDDRAAALEELMLALRTRRGLDLDGYASRHGIDLDRERSPEIQRFVTDGLLARRDGRLAPTAAGMAVADALVRTLSV